MHSSLQSFRPGCFFLLLFLTASCGLSPSLVRPTRETDFLQEVVRLERMSREHPDTRVRAQAHLELASLYVDHRNPGLNYSRALQEMEIYLSLSSDKTQTTEFQNWLAALREMDQLREDWAEMAEQNRVLQKRIDRLQLTLEKLQEANNKMRETIERLKTLDHQMEEKRRSLR